jgi:hypothetical protein
MHTTLFFLGDASGAGLTLIMLVHSWFASIASASQVHPRLTLDGAP